LNRRPTLLTGTNDANGHINQGTQISKQAVQGQRRKGLVPARQAERLKLWRLKYYLHGIEKGPLALGAYPEISLKRARDKRDAARALLDSDIDPAVRRREEKAAAQRAHASAEMDTYAAVADEWFALYVDEMRAAGRALSPDTRKKIEWLLALAAYRERKNRAPHPLNSWLHRPIASITKQDVASVIGGLKRRAKIETAHRQLHALSRLFNYAVGTGRMQTNPAHMFADSGDPRDKLPPIREKNHPGLTDPREVGRLLRGIDAYVGYPATQAAFKVAPILFSRPKELRRARWEEFDLGGKTPAWRVPQGATKMRIGHIIPLPTQVIAILKELHALTGPAGYVFPQMKEPTRPLSQNALTMALRRMGYQGEQSWHGFRTTASTLLRELGWDPDLVERQLSHDVGSDVARAYDKSTLFPIRRQMMQAWADYLDELKADRGKTPGSAARDAASGK
jgi:integrase